MPEEQNNQPISDDQELAKVLAGVTEQADAAANSAAAPVDTSQPSTSSDDSSSTADLVMEPASDPVVTPTVEPFSPPSPVPSTGNGELDAVKLEALNELRPLVDKLNVSPEEKFDTYLLLLRSTDDKDLIAPAHEAAKNIPDETRKAQALLDIIKEIDFLSGQSQQ